MASINKVIIIGNLGRDPEVRYTPSSAAVCNLRIATTRSWKDKQSGEKQEETEWHSVVLYDRQAEVAGEYLKQGRPVYIEGRLKTRKWQDKEGQDRYTTEVIAETMQLLGGRDDSEKPAPQSNQQRQQPRTHGEQRAAQREGYGPDDRQQRPAQRPAPKSSTGFDDMADDIPF